MRLKNYLTEIIDIDKSQFLKKLGDPRKDIEKIIKPLKSVKRNPKKIKKVVGWFDHVFKLIGDYEKVLKDKDESFRKTLDAFDAILSQMSFANSDLRSNIKEYDKWPEVKVAARKLLYYWKEKRDSLDYLMKVSG